MSAERERDSEDAFRDSDECHWCGGDLADGGSITVQMNEGEPDRETCPDCLRDWPPEQVKEAEA